MWALSDILVVALVVFSICLASFIWGHAADGAANATQAPRLVDNISIMKSTANPRQMSKKRSRRRLKKIDPDSVLGNDEIQSYQSINTLLRIFCIKSDDTMMRVRSAIETVSLPKGANLLDRPDLAGGFVIIQSGKIRAMIKDLPHLHATFARGEICYCLTDLLHRMVTSQSQCKTASLTLRAEWDNTNVMFLSYEKFLEIVGAGSNMTVISHLARIIQQVTVGGLHKGAGVPHDVLFRKDIDSNLSIAANFSKQTLGLVSESAIVKG